LEVLFVIFEDSAFVSLFGHLFPDFIKSGYLFDVFLNEFGSQLIIK